MYDVIVIGSGPGGATASRSLANLGLEVCMIDKDAFPRDKPCGGGFPQTITNEFSYLKPRAHEFLKGIARAGVVHSPNRQIVLEGRLDITRAKKVVIQDDGVTVALSEGKSVQGKVLIGADGVTSMVARETQLNRRWQSSGVTVCRVCEVPASTQDILSRYTEDLKCHFFTNFGGQPGYGWVFPKRETINIGLGIVGTHASGLPRMFDAFVWFLKKRNLLPEVSDISTAKGALIPTAGPIKQTVTNRCVLIGDSAGHVSPISGGGIVYAMRAARHASHVIANAIENDTLDVATLRRYQRLCQSDFGNDFRNQLIAQKLFTGPFTDLLFHIGSKDEKIQEIVSESMSESSDEAIDVKQLAIRTLMVCLREALRF
ncbi:MAG: FAD-dependent monooxygenase [Candidatus Thorarchaeota archaeon]|jgi:flavin-dependent dehydrogenase